MKLRGSLLVIVCCLVVEFCDIINQKEYASGNLIYTISVITLVGIMFLLYPLVGHLTDVYLTRYRSLKYSFGFLVLAACIGTIYESVLIAISIIEKFQIFQFSYAYVYVVPIILSLVYTVGLALFQANAIQFGLDQLLEASTQELISFIHWYYWAQNVGSLAFFYVVASSVFIMDKTDEKTNGMINRFLIGRFNDTILFCFLIVLFVAVTAVLVKFYSTKKALLHSESWTKSIQKHLQSSQILLEAQGP